MIKIVKVGDNITISGHSLPNICASVSNIMYTTVNALMKYDEYCISYTDDKTLDIVGIDIIKHDYIIDLLVNNMIDMFIDLSGDYPYNVGIEVKDEI